MQDVISFIVSLFSFFILAHFIYRITGKIKLAYAFLAVIIIINLADFITFIQLGYQFKALLFVFIIQVFPGLFALGLFMKFVGGFPIRFKKRKRLNLKTNTIYQTFYQIKLTLISTIISGLFLVVSLFFLEDILKWMIIVLASFMMVFGVLFMFKHKDFKKDIITLIIGKDKSLTYTKELKRNQFKDIQELYHNDAYLIDKIATLLIYEDNHLIEKHYIYWIATSQSFEIDQDDFVQTHLKYQHIVDGLVKYKDPTLKLVKTNDSYDLLKQKR